MTILLVDDDPFIVDMYKLKLNEAGFKVDFATDGRKGLEKIKVGGYDLILLDIVLPISDGFEILQTLRRENIAHPPIILLTNLGQKEDVDKGLALGAQDYIIKSDFTPSEVVDKINELVKKL